MAVRERERALTDKRGRGREKERERDRVGVKDREREREAHAHEEADHPPRMRVGKVNKDTCLVFSKGCSFQLILRHRLPQILSLSPRPPSNQHC